MHWLLAVALFGATALTDWLSARWVDASTPWVRAHLSAIHEAVGIGAGFLIYTAYQSLTLAIPCVLGAWVGSYFAGVNGKPDPDLEQAIRDAVADYLTTKAAS